MDVALILLAISPVFWLFIGYEFFKYRENYKLKDSAANTVLALLHQGTDAIALAILMPWFYVLYEYRFWDIEVSFVTMFVAFLLQDFLYYWFHRASHNIHWMWAAHVAHHSSTHMNYSTAFRQSLMYPIAGMWVFWTPVILIGYDPKVVFAVVALNLAFQFFVHTKIVGKLGLVEKLFNTPSHHRVHHAINPKYIDRNYAGVLIIWDKLFGTYVEEDEQVPCEFGIVGQLNSDNPIKISFHQWVHLFKQTKRATSWRARYKALFGYPTSSEQKY